MFSHNLSTWNIWTRYSKVVCTHDKKYLPQNKPDKFGNYKWYQWWEYQDNGMCTPIPNLLVYSWSSMQMRYSSLRTDLPKLAGSHKKGTFTLHTGISLHFPWVENWQVTIFRWCRSILNVYTCWSYQQSSNINRFPGSFWNDTHNYICTLHTL